MKKIFLIFILLVTSTALAYLPTPRTILNRMAKNTGRGAYSMELEVQIESAAEPIVLREKWHVSNSEKMRVSVQSIRGISPAIKFDMVYLNGRRWATWGAQSLKSTTWSPEFIEPVLFSRSGREILNLFLASRLLNANWLREFERPSSKPVVTAQLARTGGAITYFFGERTPVASEQKLPGIWIEQDAFLLRRVRFASQSEVQLDDYQLKSGIWLPEERSLNWYVSGVEDRVRASVRLISLRSTGDIAINSPTGPGSDFPDNRILKDFYTRFR